MHNEPYKLMVTTIVGLGDTKTVLQQVLSYMYQSDADAAYNILKENKPSLCNTPIVQLVVKLYYPAPLKPELPPPRESEPVRAPVTKQPSFVNVTGHVGEKIVETPTTTMYALILIMRRWPNRPEQLPAENYMLYNEIFPTPNAAAERGQIICQNSTRVKGFWMRAMEIQSEAAIERLITDNEL